MTSKERYQWYKDNGICVHCHSEKATHGLKCERCYKKSRENARKYDKEVYEWCKEKGFCVACKKEKSVNGTNYCLACLLEKREKSKETYQPLSEEKAKEKSKRNMERYNENKERGICVRCQSRPAVAGTVFCTECRIKHNKYNKKYNREVRGCVPKELFGDGDHCSWCGKPTEKHGDKLCKRCLENSLQSIQKAIANRPADNYFAQLNKAFWLRRNNKNRGEMNVE